MKKQAGMLAVAVAAFVVGAAVVQWLHVFMARNVNVKKPVWQQGMSVMRPQAASRHSRRTSKRIGIEVYKDDNNGNLIYVSETGRSWCAGKVSARGHPARCG